MRNLYEKFEREVESDRYTTKQRLFGAAMVASVIFGSVQTAAHFELDEKIIDTAASIVGFDGPISYHD